MANSLDLKEKGKARRFDRASLPIQKRNNTAAATVYGLGVFQRFIRYPACTLVFGEHNKQQVPKLPH